MMLRATPKRWFSQNYYILEGTRQVAGIDMSRWQKEGRLTVEGVLYKAYRERLMSGAFLLETAGLVVARAEKPSAFWRRFLIEYRDRQFMLQAKSVFKREFILLDGQSEIGLIAPEGFLTRRAIVDLPDELPLFLRTFILWLVIILWERDSDSSSTAAGG